MKNNIYLNLRVYKFDTLNALKLKLNCKISEYKNEYGVLCFLYSLLLTKVINLKILNIFDLKKKINSKIYEGSWYFKNGIGRKWRIFN